LDVDDDAQDAVRPGHPQR